MRDRRQLTPAEPPPALLHFRESDWVGPPNPLDDPQEVTVLGSMAPGMTPEEQARRFLGRPHIRWAAARRYWLREHARTEAEFDRLWAPDVVFPPDFHPDADYRLTAMLTGHRDWGRWAADRP